MTTEHETREFGRSGWILVAAIILAFIVSPLLIYIHPPYLPFKFAYLILPMIPALALGGISVWAAQKKA